MTAGRLPAWGVLAAAALAVFAADQALKLWVLFVLDLPEVGRIAVAPPFLNLVMAWNRGINFGLGAGGPEGMRWVLIGVALAISAALAAWVLTRRPGLAVAAGVVIGGALGNALDRVLWGAVADFLNMSCCGIENPYAFNLADTAIFLGAVVLALRA